MEILLIFENHHSRALFHLVLQKIATAHFICFYFSQNARNYVVIKFLAKSLHLKALEWFKVLKNYLNSSAFFNSMCIHFFSLSSNQNWVVKILTLHFIIINHFYLLIKSSFAFCLHVEPITTFTTSVHKNS